LEAFVTSRKDCPMTLQPSDSTPLTGMRVAVLVAEGVEDLEYWVSVMRLREAGATVTSIGMTLDTVHGKNGLAARADLHARDADAGSFDALVIPGGWLPDKLRRYDEVKNLTRSIHGGLIAISAGIIQAGHPATGSLGIKDDLVNAGARWVDEPAFRDGTLVWGRVVEDIPDFEREMVALFAEHHAAVAAR
jgi:protease I